MTAPDNCPLCGTPLERDLPEHLEGGCAGDPTDDHSPPGEREGWRAAFPDRDRQSRLREWGGE